MSTALQLSPEQRAKIQAAVDAARELKTRRTDEPLKYYTPLPHGVAFHASKAKERWLVAGNGAGKTEIGAAEVAKLITGKADWWDKPPGEVWCGAVGLGDSVAVQRPAVARYIPKALIKSWPHRDDGGAESVLTLTNGWVVRFKASNQYRERWQGGNVALVWFDEEPDPDVFDEAFARTRVGGRVILTFTPLNGLKWEAAYTRVYQAWTKFRAAHPNAKHGEVSPGLEVFTASVTDNPHVKLEDIEAQRRLWSHRPLMLRVREHGEWLNLNAEGVVAVDKLKPHAFTFNSPPLGTSWAEVKAWCDPAFSKNETSDRWAIGLAARDAVGRVYLLAMDYGRMDTDERVMRTVGFLAQYDYPTCYIQPVSGDRMFATICNSALMAVGARACVTDYGTKAEGKVERANAFAVAAGNGQVFIHDSLDEFRREAASFPHGSHDDVFDAGMGACMSLIDGRTSDAPWDANEAARVSVSRHRDDDAPTFDDDEPGDDWRLNTDGHD